MNIASSSVADILKNQVTLEVESLDRVWWTPGLLASASVHQRRPDRRIPL